MTGPRSTVARPRRRPDLEGIATYSSAAPGPVPVVVRASSNEAPGPTPDDVVAAATVALRDAGRYPVIGGRDLAASVAASLGLDEQQVCVADGSLSLLDRVLLAFVTPGDEVVMAWRSYEAYPLSVQMAGGRAVRVPLDAAGRHDLPAMLEAVGDRTRVVIVCQPNNPTGTAVPWPQVVELLDEAPPDVVVVLDLAYLEYVDDPALVPPDLSTLLERPNVLVLRTFSKAHALAGLRAGYALANTELVAAVRSVSPPFPVSAPASAAAQCSLQHPEWVADRVVAARAGRERLGHQLDACGLPWLPSQANFVWLPLGPDSVAFAEVCAAHGVLVRPFAGEGVRITVGHEALESALAPALEAWRDR